MNEEKKSKFSPLIYTVILAVIAIAVIIGIRVGAKIKAIEVEGLSSYTKEEVVTAAELSVGMRLYAPDEDEVNAKLQSRFPMIESVTFDRRGFTDLILVITEKVPTYFAEQNGIRYYLTEDFTLLKTVTADTPHTENVPTRLLLPTITSAQAGQKLTFLEESDTSWMVTFCQEVRAFSFGVHISIINIVNRFSLSAVYDSHLELVFGNRLQMAQKGEKIASLLSVRDANLIAKIDVSDPDHMFYTERAVS